MVDSQTDALVYVQIVKWEPQPRKHIPYPN